MINPGIATMSPPRLPHAKRAALVLCPMPMFDRMYAVARPDSKLKAPEKKSD